MSSSYAYYKVEKMYVKNYKTSVSTKITELFYVLKSYDGHTWINENDWFQSYADAEEFIRDELNANG